MRIRDRKLTSKFTKEEEEIIRANYSTKTSVEMCALLPGRSAGSIVYKAGHLGLKKQPGVKRTRTCHKNAYSEQESEIMLKHYANSTHTELESLLPGRDRKSINTRAKKMGLRKSKEFISRIRGERHDRKKAMDRDYKKQARDARPKVLKSKTLSVKKENKPKPQKVYQNKTVDMSRPVKIDGKTTIYLKPGQTEQQARELYAQRMERWRQANRI